MRSKHSQNKFVRFITIPIRVLGKARDLYVRSLTDYAKGARYSKTTGLPAAQFTALPKSYSVVSSRSNDNEDYRELVRAASVRSMGHTNETEMLQQQLRLQSTAKVVVGSKGFPKSCSVGMGFMGRIDEEKDSDFGEDSVGSANNNNNNNNKPDQLYSRSRTVSVTSRSTGF